MDKKNATTLREMVQNDVRQAHELSQAVGWGHRAEDWQLMFDIGKGIVAVGPDQAVQGVAMWWPYGAEFATVGMVIVSPTLQRSGIGRRLMDAILSAAGGRRLLLNATSKGIKLYENLGFEATGGIYTHYGTLAADFSPISSDDDVRELREQDWPAIIELDRTASGMDRTDLLVALKEVSRGLVIHTGETIGGYILCRQFQRGLLLGPLIAKSERDALTLLSAAAVRTEGILRADIPEDAKELARWLNEAGLVEVGRVTTMWRPVPPAHHQEARVFGLSSQALG